MAIANRTLYSKGAKVGDRFGKLIIAELISAKNGGFTAVCTCDCGGSITRSLSEIGAYVLSCGCVHVRHGHSKGKRPTREYRTWREIRQRCENPHNHAYGRYGAKGINVCERWQLFANFLEDMGEVPKGKSIDRINNDLGYAPDNCRWATPLEQSRNRSNVHIHTVGDVSLYAPEWAVRLGIPYRSLAHYLTKHDMENIVKILAIGKRPQMPIRRRS